MHSNRFVLLKMTVDRECGLLASSVLLTSFVCTLFLTLFHLLLLFRQMRRQPRSNLTGPKDTEQAEVDEVTFRGLDENGYERAA